MNAERKPVDAGAVSVMVLLCLIWGIGHVAAKFTAQGISLVFQSGLRSVIATALLLAWVHLRGTPLWERDRTFWPGVFAGILFATEFVFIFSGLALTDAARMVVFVYLAPCMTALGLHFLIPAERLNARQWAGILVAFAGVAVAFGDGFSSGRGRLAGRSCQAGFWPAKADDQASASERAHAEEITAGDAGALGVAHHLTFFAISVAACLIAAWMRL